jgi:tetratricopeptide (TPR) repeat protein
MGGDLGAAGVDRVDLFVSYAGPDRPWAQWAASVLETAGYTVELDIWDWAAGQNVVVAMSDALVNADRVLGLWSAAYFERDRFTTDEWTALLAERPGVDGQRGRLVPVRVQNFDRGVIPAVLRPVIYRDVFGLDEARARGELLAALGSPSGRGQAYPFPGEPSVLGGAGAGGVRVPGSLPPVWNLPRRNPGFTGRQALLADLHERLTGAGGGRVWVQALNGIGGVGKTQAVIEYAHIFAGEYDLAWWIDAERADLIDEQLAALAVAAGWAPATAAVGEAVQIVGSRLRQARRWLVVFDNVEDPAGVRDLMPQGPGQVIVTSRRHAWTGLAESVGVEVFTRAESVELLRAHLPALSEADADAMADAVGDLPLALAQAAGLLAETAMTAREYLAELAAHTREVLGSGGPAGYPRPLAATISLALHRLQEVDPAAVQVLRLAAVLAPEPVLLDWFSASSATGTLPEVLRPVVGRILAWRRALGRISDLGLAGITDATLTVHRLTQAVLRDHREPNQLTIDRDHAARLLIAAAPNDSGQDPATWPAWAALLPHLLTLDPAHTPALHNLALDTQWYLIMRGDYLTALLLARSWREHWQDSIGPDHPNTLNITNQLAETHRYLGRYQEAHDLHQATHEAMQQVMGPDHPHTLSAADGLAVDLYSLGRYQEAHDLHQATHEAMQQVMGPDHPHTLNSAHNLAETLRELGRHQEALDLNRVTYQTRLRILGSDHPNTLAVARSLAQNLTALGDHREAHDLGQDVYAACQRILGPDHPHTLTTANNLTIDLNALGRTEEADALAIDVRERKHGSGSGTTTDSQPNDRS